MQAHVRPPDDFVGDVRFTPNCLLNSFGTAAGFLILTEDAALAIVPDASYPAEALDGWYKDICNVFEDLQQVADLPALD